MDWPVQSSARKAAATGTASSRTYVVAEPMAASYGKQFDQITKVPWFSYFTGSTWRQVWYDDSLSLAYKYNMVTSKGLGGIGIWALSYDGARQEIWSGIKVAFATTGVHTDQTVYSEDELSLRNYPNPFNPTTNLEFSVSSSAFVTLRVYDALGREVGVLVDEMKSPGKYTVKWDASTLPTGAYFCRLQSGSRILLRPMMLTK
jgi:GH18 family chitinase